MMSSSGGVWTQPILGKAADVWGYAPSYVMGAGISILAVPFLGRTVILELLTDPPPINEKAYWHACPDFTSNQPVPLAPKVVCVPVPTHCCWACAEPAAMHTARIAAGIEMMDRMFPLRVLVARACRANDVRHGLHRNGKCR